MGIKSCRFCPIIFDDIIYFGVSDRFCIAAVVPGLADADANRDNFQSYHCGDFVGLAYKIPLNETRG
jgi:hypothetical protein